MNFAKVASTTPSRGRGRGSVTQRQTGDRTKEQENLLEFVRGPRYPTPKSASETKVLRPPGSQVFQTTRLPNLEYRGRGPVGLSREPNNFKQKLETTEQKKERLKKSLNKYESPFIWKANQAKRGNGKKSLLCRLHEKDEEIKETTSFKWRSFILQLVMSYEHFKVNEVEKAEEKLLGLKNILIDNDSSRDWMFVSIKDALWHVINTSIAFLYLELNCVEEAEKLTEMIVPLNRMRATCRAGIFGIRAAVFMEYGHRGNVYALEEAKRAVELDRSSAEWHFLVAKCMGILSDRIPVSTKDDFVSLFIKVGEYAGPNELFCESRVRRVVQCYEMVDVVELKALTKAVQLDQRNPLYKVYLAQAIRERAFKDYKTKLPKWGSEHYNKLMKAFTAAKYKYKEAKELNPDCPHLLARCAYGTMKLPDQMVDLKFVRECIDKALELAPHNSMIHHFRGLYYERFHVEADTAEGEIKQAAELGNFGASMDLVRMHYRLKRNTTIEELEALASLGWEPSELQVLYTQAGSYLLFIEKDLIGALKYFNKVIEMNPESYAMKSHKSMFLRMRKPVNMFEVMIEELDSRTNWNSFAPEDKIVLRKFRIQARRHESTEENEKRLTVEDILEMSKNQLCKDERYKDKKAIRAERRRKKIWKGKKKSNNKKNKKEDVNKAEQKENVEKKGSRGKERLSFERNKNVGERTSSVCSFSSVESDYQRDRTLKGPRGFFEIGSRESLHSERSIVFGNMRAPFSRDSRESSVSSRLCEGANEVSQSRGSSVCSNSSGDSRQGPEINLEYQKSLHESRCSQSITNTTEKSQLTVENLQNFDLRNPSSYRPQKTSVMSMSGSGAESCGSGLSVMERVKQSYAMLNYKSGDQNQGNKLPRSGSSQSLHNQQNKKQGSKKFDKKGNGQKGGSNQSLDVQNKTPFRNRFAEGYKSSFSSRDSSVDSSRSLSFMPSFVSKTSDDSEKL